MQITKVLPMLIKQSTTLAILLFLAQCTSTTTSFCTGELRTKDIAGIWRLTSKKSFLPKAITSNYPLKEFTVYPKKKPRQSSSSSGNNSREDILLLLREDGKFVQYSSPQTESSSSSSKKRGAKGSSVTKDQNNNNNRFFIASEEMKGSWGLVDGKLILAADRPNGSDVNSRRDTILEGRVVAVSDESLVDNPALQQQQEQKQQQKQQQKKEQQKKEQQEEKANREDVHLSVPKGKVKIGKFFYPPKHPSFFEQPMFDSTSTGSFELRQILGNLNTQLNGDDKDNLVEKFKKKDLMDKRYFITSYPLPNTRKRRKRWSIKYNKFVGTFFSFKMFTFHFIRRLTSNSFFFQSFVFPHVKMPSPKQMNKKSGRRNRRMRPSISKALRLTSFKTTHFKQLLDWVIRY